jgi:hypothetical protein
MTWYTRKENSLVTLVVDKLRRVSRPSATPIRIQWVSSLVCMLSLPLQRKQYPNP